LIAIHGASISIGQLLSCCVQLREFCKVLREKVNEGQTDDEITSTINDMTQQVDNDSNR